ncbi:hypothetical protein B7463_g4770, partial [Scytalidium lignicola]
MFCGTLVLKVYAWSSKPQDYPVDTEYIIMERIAGIQLSSVWKALQIDKKTEVIKTLTAYQKAWMLLLSSSVGAFITHKTFQKARSRRLFLTPIKMVLKLEMKVLRSDQRSIDNQSTMKDRGLVSIGDLVTEKLRVNIIEPLPKSPIPLASRYVPTREKKHAALQSYTELIKFLLPTDPLITTSHIWHSDLHDENIFVNPDRPTKIIGIKDWQSVALVPLFENLIRPALLNYNDGHDYGFLLPKFIYYTNKRLYSAIEFYETISFDLLSYAGNILIDGEAIYQERVTDELRKMWNTLPGVQALNNPPYPFNFSNEDLDAIQGNYEGMSVGIMCMSQIQKEMGPLFPGDKLVSHEKYNEIKRIFKEHKAKVLNEFARNEEKRAAVIAWWPFD